MGEVFGLTIGEGAIANFLARAQMRLLTATARMAVAVRMPRPGGGLGSNLGTGPRHQRRAFATSGIVSLLTGAGQR